MCNFIFFLSLTFLRILPRGQRQLDTGGAGRGPPDAGFQASTIQQQPAVTMTARTAGRFRSSCSSSSLLALLLIPNGRGRAIPRTFSMLSFRWLFQPVDLSRRGCEDSVLQTARERVAGSRFLLAMISGRVRTARSPQMG